MDCNEKREYILCFQTTHLQILHHNDGFFLTASVVFHPQYKYMKFASVLEVKLSVNLEFPSAPLARNGCNENRLDS